MWTVTSLESQKHKIFFQRSTDMERLRTLFGLKDRESIQDKQIHDRNPVPTPHETVLQNSIQKGYSHHEYSHTQELNAQDKPVEKHSIQHNMKDFITKYIPLEEGECLSCKLISSTTVSAAGVYSLLKTWKNEIGYTGLRKFQYRMFGIGLFTASILSTCMILFNVGLFERKEGKIKPVDEILKEDLKKYKQFFNRLSEKYDFNKDSVSDNSNDR